MESDEALEWIVWGFGDRLQMPGSLTWNRRPFHANPVAPRSLRSCLRHSQGSLIPWPHLPIVRVLSSPVRTGNKRARGRSTIDWRMDPPGRSRVDACFIPFTVTHHLPRTSRRPSGHPPSALLWLLPRCGVSHCTRPKMGALPPSDSWTWCKGLMNGTRSPGPCLDQSTIGREAPTRPMGAESSETMERC